MTDSPSPTFGLIGTGMMGISLALAYKRQQPTKLIGYDIDEAAEIAVQNHLIDERVADVQQLWQRADIIVFACPINATLAHLKQLPAPKPNQLIMDLGSVKQVIVTQAETSWQQASENFVGCHPIAGLENQGPLAADINLYQRAKVLITPHRFNSSASLQRAKAFWQSLNSLTIEVDAKRHDQLLAEVSHLPHLLAFCLVESLFQRYGMEVFQWSAGGFRDFTRIASSNPIMWRDICQHNQPLISQALQQLIETLQQTKKDIDNHAIAEIERRFNTAKKARDKHYQRANEDSFSVKLIQ